jgi:hypothetical protein
MAETLDPLKSHRWQNRIILHTTDAESTDALTNALERYEKEIKNRDLVFVDLETVTAKPRKHHLELDMGSIKSLRKTLNATPGKTELILLGKDGGIKERIDRIDLKHLFAVIDQMPMRRAEMRSKP